MKIGFDDIFMIIIVLSIIIIPEIISTDLIIMGEMAFVFIMFLIGIITLIQKYSKI